jgi:uncharacterized protein YndB with AHSA1/START domain
MADLEGSETIEIEAPIERVFATAADVERAPEWHGAMRRADAVERDADGRPTLVDTAQDALVTSMKLLLRFSYEEPHAIRWTRERGDLKSLEGAWLFEDLGGGRTLATYNLEIGLNRALSLLRKGVRGPAEAKVRELLARRPVEGLKQAVEDAAA